jgi:arylsulfatase A-like enzyme
MGFHQRYIVENKDRFLEDRLYFDEWDKALASRGVVKPTRVQYRQRSDYRERLGAFEWELPEELHSDIFVGNLALWWISSYPKTEPLFLQIGFPGPHPPYDPLPGYTKAYLDKDLLIQDVSKQEMDDQPPPLQAMRRHNAEVDHDAVVHLDFPSREQRHRQRACYLANITMVDEKIGQILQALETSGYLDRSVVIFTSDHGDSLGDHGHSHKWTMYDAVTRVPAIVWAPSLYPGGRRIDDLCQQMDLGATILDLAGTPKPASMEAASLVPLLRGDKVADGREFVFAEHGRDGILQDAENMIMVRSRNWKLVCFLDEQYGQLFNLTEDPEEVRDLWIDPAIYEKKQELLEVLREWFIGSVYRTRGWKSEWR